MLFLCAFILNVIFIHSVAIIFFYKVRVKDLEKRRILDEAARRRRARKALEALEQDNYQVDFKIQDCLDCKHTLVK